ncbi:hypothetical protein J2X63_000334 [Agromyces sp. 3263]|uniref:hypothetical protein n=1 Tax=Agromyces sp. 3263 TaxID=2817750 RepID=UPI002856BBC5|nr:hypothetical protein [Agromyces sp. 3263]MDR6904648.1 hypothetical protein [Agromyces sp. 3263]
MTQTTTNSTDRRSSSKRLVGGRAWVTRVLPPALLVIASLLVGIVHVPQHESLSPIDEYVYVDYFDKVFDQGVVRHGEEVGDFARQELGCRGLRILLPVPDDRCTTAESILSDDSRFPMAGMTSADIYTPLYFAVTRAFAQPLLWTGVVDSPTQAGRLVGTLWLAAAALLFFFALRRLRLGPWSSAGITLLIVGSLPAYWYTTYLSTDAPTLLAGALMLFLGIRFVQGDQSGWWLVAAAPIVIWLKFQNFAAIGAVAISLALLAVYTSLASPRGGRWRSLRTDRRLLVAIGMVVAALLAQVIWVIIREQLSLGVSPEQNTEQALTVDGLLGLVFKYVSSSGLGVGAPSGTAIVASWISQWVAVAGVLGLAAVARPGTRTSALAYGTLLMALVVGPLLALSIIASTGEYFALPERYGLSLYPIFIGCAAVLVRRRRSSTVVLAGLGVLSFICVLLIPAV